MNFNTAIFYTRDINKAVDFYQGLLGLEVDYRRGDEYVSFIFFNKIKLGVKKAIEKREVPGSQTIIISLDNIDVFYEEIKKKDVALYDELTNESWGKTFSILDIDGNKIEFLEE
jgi:catechol 2,3-dioxygenase-like lactoylglutathione lyase family enzyme